MKTLLLRSKHARWVRWAELVLAVAGMADAPVAHAEPAPSRERKIVARESVYADNDDTLVATTLVDGQVALPAGFSAGAHVMIDVVSSASVDVVSAATERFEEPRLEAGVRAGYLISDTLDAGVTFTRSFEHDYESFMPSLSLGIDLAQRNTRITAGYGTTYSLVGRAGDPTFEERLLTHMASLGLSQVLSRSTLWSASYTFAYADGFQSSPYRFVTVVLGPSVLERHPETRMRHALNVNVLCYLRRGLALEAGYRFYLDDWWILSNTFDLGLRLRFFDRLTLRARGRGYYQNDAGFWRKTYTRTMRFMSADKELSAFWDVGGGLKIGWEAEYWSVDLKGDVIYYDFLNFARLESRVARIVDLGIGARW